MKNEKSAPGGAVEVFDFNRTGKQVRVQMIEGTPWFVAKDVCEIVGIKKYRDALARLDDDERCPLLMDTPGGTQRMTAVSEGAVYNLIFISRKPEARRFRRWVTDEVLPSLRREGRYELGRGLPEVVDARDVAFDRVGEPGRTVRRIGIGGETWYSVADLQRYAGRRADGTKAARQLNAVRRLAIKIRLYQSSQAEWFTTQRGAELIVSTAKRSAPVEQLTLGL